MKLHKATTQLGLLTGNIVSDNIRQKYDDTCAIKSQEIIMNSMGLHATEELRIEAIQNG